MHITDERRVRGCGAGSQHRAPGWRREVSGQGRDTTRMTSASRDSGSGGSSGAKKIHHLGVEVKDAHLRDAGIAMGRPEVSLVTVQKQPSRTQPGTHTAQSTDGSPVPTAADSAAARP